MSRSEPAAQGDVESKLHDTLTKLCPMRDDKFEEIAKIIPSTIGGNARAVARDHLRKAIELGWRCHELKRAGRAGIPTDGAYLVRLRRAATLAAKVSQASRNGVATDWKRKQATLSNLTKIREALEVLRRWTTPHGISTQGALVLASVRVTQIQRELTRMLPSEERVQRHANALALLLNSIGQSKAKPGPTSQESCLRSLVAHLDITYWSYRRADLQQSAPFEHLEMLEPVIEGSYELSREDAMKRNRWIKSVLNALGVTYPISHSDEFDALLRR